MKMKWLSSTFWDSYWNPNSSLYQWQKIHISYTKGPLTVGNRLCLLFFSSLIARQLTDTTVTNCFHLQSLTAFFLMISFIVLGSFSTSKSMQEYSLTSTPGLSIPQHTQGNIAMNTQTETLEMTGITATLKFRISAIDLQQWKWELQVVLYYHEGAGSRNLENVKIWG